MDGLMWYSAADLDFTIYHADAKYCFLIHLYAVLSLTHALNGWMEWHASNNGYTGLLVQIPDVVRVAEEIYWPRYKLYLPGKEFMLNQVKCL